MLSVAICPIGRDFYGCYIYIFGSYRVFHGGVEVLYEILKKL